MIRTINFTGRKRISREAARITLRPEAGGAVAFDAELDFNGLALPPKARVYIEAAFKTTFMRFEWGAVAQLTPPDDRRLSRLKQPALAHFRVKVVESTTRGFGRLLAVADHIAPEGTRGGEKHRVSLFRVNLPPTGLADEVWKLGFDLDGPILDLSSQIPGIKDIVRQEAFMALVFPSVVRQVFARIFDDGYDDPNLDVSSWQSRWLRYGYQLVGESHPQLQDSEPNEDHDKWIDSVVTAWCRRQKVVSNFKRCFAGAEVTTP
jgi:hypothetical protein